MQLAPTAPTPAPVAPSPITITVMRQHESGGVSPISDEMVAADADMRDTVANIRGFDAWLRSHGRNGWNDVGGDIKLAFVEDDPDGASFDMDRPRTRGWIRLGEPTSTYARSPGASPVLIGHEMTHGIYPRTYVTKEGVGDVIGHAFASDSGHPAGSHWRMADEVLRPPRKGSGLRDGANPRLPDVNAVVADIVATGIAPTVHDLSGPVTLAAARLERELGAPRSNAIWGQSILHHVDGSAWTEALTAGEQAAAARTRDPQRIEASIPRLEQGSYARYVGELRALAAANEAAVHELGGPPERIASDIDAIQRVWEGVGALW